MKEKKEIVSEEIDLDQENQEPKEEKVLKKETKK